MRITSDMYYRNLYANSSGNLNSALYDVNKQIASGLKIEYAHDDIRIFSETMRLDNEITVLNQTKNSANSAFKFSDQSDSILNEFNTTLNRMNVLLVKSANGTNNEASMDAITKELREIQKHLLSLANTSINGQYLFSGSNVATKPIDDNGKYQGNNISMEALIGSNNRQAYNITGADFFLGEERSTAKEITTNVVNKNLLSSYSAFRATTDNSKPELDTNSTMRELMGDTNNIIGDSSGYYFYISGTKSDGTSFKDKINLTDTDTVGQLLDHIGGLYGNSLGLSVVDVSLNDNGEIVVKDKIRGSSKLDFHMVGATDFSGGAAANVADINSLSVGERNFDSIALGTSTATNPNLFVKEFVKSYSTVLDGNIYDQASFGTNGPKLSSNVSQIVKGTNAFATDGTKLLDVASGSSLNNKRFILKGTDIMGASFTMQLDLKNIGSTFSLDGGTTNYQIFDVNSSPRVAIGADSMTYRQLMDVVNMATSATLPASTSSATDYDNAITSANNKSRVNLSYDGKIEFMELNKSSTQAKIALYDVNGSDFTQAASAMTFNTNASMSVKDPKTDFFKSIDDIIRAVENYSQYPDSNNKDPRSMGIQNAMGLLENLSDHVLKIHSTAGAQSNALTTSIQRSDLLIISSKSLRSSVVDTDTADAYLQLTQLNNNYQAMLSTVSKVSKLSLVNYL